MTRALSWLRFLFWSLLIVVAAVATVRIVYTESSIPSTRMDVTFTAPEAGTTHLFLAAEQAWATDVPTALPVIAGLNRATFDLSGAPGEMARWDPGTSAGDYAISSIVFTVDGAPYELDLSIAVSTPETRSTKQTIRAIGSQEILLSSTDGDPQLLVDIPPAAVAPDQGNWTLALSLVAALTTMGLMVVVWRKHWWNEEWFAIGLVMWLYVTFAFYVSKLASRLPFWDDWRYLRDLDASGRLPISPRALLRPFNDTVGATGKLIDAIVLNATRFDFYALQMVGVLLLGVYIGLMVVLVRVVGRRVAPTATPYAILLVSLSLVSMSYWLEPAVAYHQFLPIFFAVPILLLMRPTGHATVRSLAIGVLGLLAGFAYISGAVLLLVMGFAFVAAYVRRWPTRQDMRRLAPGLVIVATGVISAMSQLFLVSRAQGSLALSSSVADSAYPWEPDFWAFYVGVAGRALGVQSGPMLIYVAIFASLVLAPVAVAFIVRAPNRYGGSAYEAFVLLFAALLVPVYIAIVSFGRAGLISGQSLSDGLAFGGARFHFWWVAALIPLVWLGWVAFLGRQPARSRTAAIVVLVLVTVALAVPKTLAPWHYPTGFSSREIAFERTTTCVASNALQGNASFTCRHASSGNIGPQLDVGYLYDMTFIERGRLPDAPPHP